MKLPEHITLSFLLAQFGVQEEYGWAGTALVIAAGVLPDLDGIGVIFGWRFYQRYHRVLGHGLPLTLFGPPLLAGLGAWLFGVDFLPLWAWCQVSLVGHLVTDVLFYRWPVQLLWPISSRGWEGGLVGWNDLIPTFFLYTASVVALIWPGIASLAAALGIGGMVLYLLLRAGRRRDAKDRAPWLQGGWTVGAHPFWRWLTGDFIHGKHGKRRVGSESQISG
jgi:LexA-binding, inner membrane-associated putative hydrolase